MVLFYPTVAKFQFTDMTPFRICVGGKQFPKPLIHLFLQIKQWIKKSYGDYFWKSNRGVRNPKHLKKIFFLIYPSKKVKIEPATCLNIETQIILSLAEKSNRFVTSIFRGDEINEIRQKMQGLWIEIRNKSFEDTIEVKRYNPLRCVAIQPGNLKFN